MQRYRQGLMMVAGVALALAAPAAANTATYTSGPVSLSGYDWGTVLDIPQMDPVYYKLDSAKVTVGLNAWGGAGEFDNEVDAYVTLTLFLQRIVEVTAVGWPVEDNLLALVTTGTAHRDFLPEDDPGEWMGLPDWTGPDYLSVTGAQGFDSETLTHYRMPPGYGDPLKYLYAYVGTGYVSFDYSSYARLYTLDWPEQRMTSDVQGSMTISVTYTYDPIPEPMTLGLLAFGALALMRRRTA